MPLDKVQDFYSEGSKLRRLNKRSHLTMVIYHVENILENARGIENI